ncbi:MAG: 50S ribosomal protein L24 [Planctomycetota bacterium]|nr:MAG: 50S ribosomal protein L24 [Planctomycetota bacterium]
MASAKSRKKRPKCRIKRGDIVRVIAGKDALSGKEGKVLRVFPAEGRLIVEGANYSYKHLRKSQDHPKGGRIEREAPIDISNVMLVCPSCERATRVRVSREKDGKVERICKKCNKAF